MNVLPVKKNYLPKWWVILQILSGGKSGWFSNESFGDMEEGKEITIAIPVIEKVTPPKVVDALALLCFKGAELVSSNSREDRYDDWGETKFYIYRYGQPNFHISADDFSFLLDNKIVEFESGSGGEEETMWSESYRLTDYCRTGLENRVKEAQQKNKTAQL